MGVLLADNAAGQNERLAVRVEVIAGVDAVLGLVDGVLMVVDQGDFAPQFSSRSDSAQMRTQLSAMGFSFRNGVCRAGARSITVWA